MLGVDRLPHPRQSSSTKDKIRNFDVTKCCEVKGCNCLRVRQPRERSIRKIEPDLAASETLAEAFGLQRATPVWLHLPR